MKKKTCYLFIFDGFADWGAAYASIGIAGSEGYQLKTIAIEMTKKQSMGGLAIIPDFDFIPEIDLVDITPDNTALLILPGGNAWEEKKNDPIESLVRHCVVFNIPVAAICGATIFLADLGLLNEKDHTSNDLLYLQAFAPDYGGKDFYRNKPSVRSKNIITANGAAAVEFAKDIFETLEVKDEAEKWGFQYFDKVII